MTRYALFLALVVAAVGLQDRAVRPGVPQAPVASVPEAVLQAAAQGRYWQATRLLDGHLAEVADTAPSTVILAARLHAGWENWPAVRRLLEGRDWLTEVEAGIGWELLGRARAAAGDWEPAAQALARYLDETTLEPEHKAVAELRRGLALGAAGRSDEALEAFDNAAELLPWFADWASFLAAEGAAAAGDLAEVDRRLRAAGEAGDDHWRLRAKAALLAGDTMTAREAVLVATRRGGRTDRAEAWSLLGQLRLAAGDSARARDAFGRAMEVRASMGAVDAARTLAALGPGPEEWRAIAAVYQWHGNAARAADGYAAYLESDVGTVAERASARLELGRARFNAGRFRQAERGLLELASDPVANGIAAEALYLAARAQYRQGRGSEGRATFLRLAERFPGGDAAARGLYLLADLEHDDLNIEGADGARAYYRRAADAAPDLNEAGLALMRLAGLAYLDGDFQGALEVWEEYRRLHPEGRRIAQATYWAARAHARLGEDSLAQARLRQVRGFDPLSYYGIRAAELLGEAAMDIPMGETPLPFSGADSAVRAGVRRVDVLAALGRRDDLVREVERLRRSFQAATGVNARAGEYALAESLNQRGYTLTGIGMGWDLYEREGEWNPRLLRIVYPFPFQNLVVPEALDRDLDPYLIAGLIRRESAFNPVVVSGAGAVGLMQIVPSTGRTLARAAGLRTFQSSLLTRPEVNIHLGTRFFAELVDRFGSSLPLILAAYNAGPTRASEWRRLPEAEDPELFIERVPYGETREYIRYVLLHRSLYRTLYPDLTDEPR